MPQKSLNDWVKTIHDYALAKGWWQGQSIKCPECQHEFKIERDDLHVMSLVHSEVSEAVEEFRKPDLITDENGVTNPEENPELIKPEGPSVELVDVLIRIMDYFGRKGWDMEKVMEMKHEYNLKRPYRHGKKY